MKVLATALLALASISIAVGCAQPPKLDGVPVETSFVEPSPAYKLPKEIQQMLKQDGKGVLDFDTSLKRPFSADQIRANTPNHLEIIQRVSSLDTRIGEREVNELNFHFSDANEESVTAVISIKAINYSETSEQTWQELSGHGVPPEGTLRYERKMKLAVDGQVHDCYVYVTRELDFGGNMVFVFAKDLPGMPMYYYYFADGVKMAEYEVISRKVNAPAPVEIAEEAAPSENPEEMPEASDSASS